MPMVTSSPTDTAEKARFVLDRIARDPVWFFRSVLGCSPYDKQRELIEAVRDNRRVACLGANGTGKDFVAGRLVLWWLASRRPAKVVVIGPTHRQVAQIVWKETRLAYFASKISLGGRMLETPRWEIDDETFALGFATDQPYNIQGHHSPHLMLIYTEAHSVSQDDIEAGKRLNPERLLLTGNPLSLAGEFYEAFHGKGEMYKTIQISAFDSPNVKIGKVVIPGLVGPVEVEERKRDWGEGTPLYQASVLGQYPDSLEDSLIPRSWVDRALQSGFQPSEPHVLACDVARGGDNTVLMRRDGPVCRIIWRGKTPDVMEIIGRVGRYLEDNPDLEKRVTIDDTGIGGGVTDRLRELGYRVNAFIAGEAAQDPRRWANAQAEAWGLMADVFQRNGVSIPPDPALITQLCTRRYKLQSDRRIILESKADLRAQGGHSPDEGDALAMCWSPIAARRIRIWV